jgi:DNA-binding CsgD family transcriptional regulator
LNPERHARTEQEDALTESNWRAYNHMLTEALKPLIGLLEDSAVGVAFYDRSLQCLAVNRAFVAMKIATNKKSAGQTIHRLLGKQAKKLELSFQHAFTSGNFLPDIELTAHSPASPEERHLRVNLYPLKNGDGRVDIVAATFSELTGSNALEFQLGWLAAKFHKDLPLFSNLFDEGFVQRLARSLQLAGRSVEMLQSSPVGEYTASRSLLDAGWLPLALFLALTRQEDASPDFKDVGSDEDRAISKHNGSVDVNDPGASGPSRRELQVLRLLSLGKINKEIGLALEISARTVETYRARIMRKLKLHSTAELVRYAIRNRLIEL